MRQQQGFTLIELVAVIVLLGILAVTALPRFVNLQGDARAATVKGAAGAIQGANAQAFAKALIQNVATVDGDAGTNPQIDIDGDGTDETQVAFGYLETIVLSVQLLSGVDTANSDLSWDDEDLTATDFIYLGYDLDGDASVVDDNCFVLYTEAANASTPATAVPTVTGC